MSQLYIEIIVDLNPAVNNNNNFMVICEQQSYTNTISIDLTNVVRYTQGTGDNSSAMTIAGTIVLPFNGNSIIKISVGFINSSGNPPETCTSEFIDSDNTVMYTTTDPITYYYDVDTGNWSDVTPCLHENTLIRTPNGMIPIKNIHAGDIVYQNGREVNVLYNAKFLPTNSYIKIDKDAFGINEPMNDFYITGTHPLWINGQEILAENLVNGTTINEVKLDSPVTCYSLVTNDRIYVDTQGLNCFTWGVDEWEKTQRESCIPWSKQ